MRIHGSTGRSTSSRTPPRGGGPAPVPDEDVPPVDVPEPPADRLLVVVNQGREGLGRGCSFDTAVTRRRPGTPARAQRADPPHGHRAPPPQARLELDEIDAVPEGHRGKAERPLLGRGGRPGLKMTPRAPAVDSRRRDCSRLITPGIVPPTASIHLTHRTPQRHRPPVLQTQAADLPGQERATGESPSCRPGGSRCGFQSSHPISIHRRPARDGPRRVPAQRNDNV